MDEVSEEMLAERYRSSPFAKPHDEFCRRWLEEHCDGDDLALMKAVMSTLWGPGVEMSETDYLAMITGHSPTPSEVQALIDYVLRLLQPCNEAWCESPEYRQLQLVHFGRRL